VGERQIDRGKEREKYIVIGIQIERAIVRDCCLISCGGSGRRSTFRKGVAGC
jgi:hypothetical protein